MSDRTTAWRNRDLLLGLASPPPQAKPAEPPPQSRFARGRLAAPPSRHSLGVVTPHSSLRSFAVRLSAPSTGKACGASPSISLRSCRWLSALSTAKPRSLTLTLAACSFCRCLSAPSRRQSLQSLPITSSQRSIGSTSYYWGSRRPLHRQSLRSLPLNLAYARVCPPGARPSVPGVSASVADTPGRYKRVHV